MEFALIAPVLFLILFGIIDFGMSLDHRITIQHAVREGARYAAVHEGCADVQQRTADRAGNIFDNCANGRCVRVSYSNNPAVAGDSVQVTAPFDWTFPLMSRFGVGQIHTHVSASARLEMAVPNAGGCGP